MVYNSCWKWLLAFLIALPRWCSETVSSKPDGASAQHVRVRMLQDVDSVEVTAGQANRKGFFRISAGREARLAFPANKPIITCLSR